MTKESFFKLKDIVAAFLLTVGLTLLVQAILAYIPYFTTLTRADISGYNFAILYLLQIVVFALPLFAIVFIRKGFKWRFFGFETVGVKVAIKYILLGYFMYWIVMMVITNLMIEFDVQLPGFETQETHMPLMGESQIEWIISALIIILVAPIFEEIFFRGFIFKTLIERSKTWIAFLISGAIFAGIHLEFGTFMPLFILGLILNWIFFKTKSIYPGILFHIINNAIALSLEYYLLS
ncbi:MAG: hypothetical protein UV80_C0002G0227 [Candidatus Peregrinibacteria bacterium GW2011_GWF2_43_17]|nr:MAG: hypothetical protein UV80_C0002G0227 [Candidatus Peregrinibacteria bacterium GW2011_GWF2_43_17]KKT20076.1 MAG: Abortive infection protein [Candidatus Peregrinibacteria bacterium GW2011_GWA2_43_8]HAU39731.1 hypothetical protein [Candidatus Peregrinibacteria bacterium]